MIKSYLKLALVLTTVLGAKETLKNQSQTVNIGYYSAKNGSAAQAVAITVGGTALAYVGAYQGAAIGAKIGIVGGPAGSVIGGVVGGAVGAL